MKKIVKKFSMMALSMIMLMLSVIPASASAKTSNYLEDHSVVDCVHYYKNNGDYYFLIKSPKGHLEDVTVSLTKDSEGTSAPCTVSFKYTSFTGLYAKEYAYSDETSDYTWLIIRSSAYPDAYETSWGGIGIKIFYFGDEDIKMATNTSNYSTTPGRGYWLSE